MVVVVAGSSGLIGTALVRRLREEGHAVRQLVRRPARAPEEYSWDPDSGVLDSTPLAGVDAVVNLAGAGIGDRRLTPARKRIVERSRTATAGLIAGAIAAMPDPPRVLLQASATGAYGYRGDAALTEDEPYGSSYLAGVVRAWEGAAAPAVEREGVRVAFLRSGIVLAPGGGALARLLPLLRLGLGGPLGSGDQWWSWISVEDEVRAIVHLLAAPVSGPVNLVAEPATNREIVGALARELRRPAVVRAPAWALRAALGEFAEEIVGSLRAVPAALDASGFVHRHRTIEQAAASVVG